MIGDPLCGSDTPTTIVSSSNELFIRFRSNNRVLDWDQAGTGFKLQLEETGKNFEKLLSVKYGSFLYGNKNPNINMKVKL